MKKHPVNRLKIATILFITSLFFVALPVFAHQPRMVEGTAIEVVDPEVSKAYYGELSGVPHTYTIRASDDFNLYIGILVPDTKTPQKDVVAEIVKDGEILETLGGSEAEWTTFFEPFGQSTYWDGGEYKARAQAGEYTIRVSSEDNDSKYSLAVGEIEMFDGKESFNALNLIPELKRDFFEESPIGFIKSPFGWGYILILYILAFIIGFLYRVILNKFAKGTARGVHKNIGTWDRVLRFAIWLALLLWAIATSWNPILLFFSGFVLFEAIFSWCGFYAAIGKNTCPF
jgi:hypothetical protein